MYKDTFFIIFGGKAGNFSMAYEEIYTFNQSCDSRDIINLSLCGITYPDKNYSITRKKSPISCIEYIEQGTGTVNIGNETFYPVEGDSYFLQSSKDHHYYSDKDTPWKKYFINVNGSLLESMVDGYGLRGVHHFRNLDTKAELCKIIELAKDRESDHSEEIIYWLNKIFLKMHKSLKAFQGKTQLAEKMKDYLSAYLSEKFSMQELCRYMSISESQCIRIFKENYGTTPYAYLIDKKISLAKKLLVNTNLSIKQIAYKLSFADEYYFSNVFKNRTGISPKAFRKQQAEQ